jgi:hypothetical protein
MCISMFVSYVSLKDNSITQRAWFCCEKDGPFESKTITSLLKRIYVFHCRRFRIEYTFLILFCVYVHMPCCSNRQQQILLASPSHNLSHTYIFPNVLAINTFNHLCNEFFHLFVPMRGKPAQWLGPVLYTRAGICSAIERSLKVTKLCLQNLIVFFVTHCNTQ